MAKNEAAKKNDNEPDIGRKDDGQLEARKRLLARMAGNVAAGIVSAPSDATATAETIAAVAVDIAEEILKKIEL